MSRDHQAYINKEVIHLEITIKLIQNSAVYVQHKQIRIISKQWYLHFLQVRQLNETVIAMCWKRIQSFRTYTCSLVSHGCNEDNVLVAVTVVAS